MVLCAAVIIMLLTAGCDLLDGLGISGDGDDQTGGVAQENLTFEDVKGTWFFPEGTEPAPGDDHIYIDLDDNDNVLTDLYYDSQMYASGNGDFDSGVYSGEYTDPDDSTVHDITISFELSADDKLTITYTGEPFGTLTLEGGVLGSTT
jgi:hypothetical protein